MLAAPVEMVLIGNGEIRSRLDGQPIPGSQVRVLDALTHDQMASGYAQLDVLVVPSHTTSTWKEQFGRVIIEALWCGVPVVGSDSGEIPWLIELTGGGLVFPEGDSGALAAHLRRLREAPELRRELAGTGRAAVERLFSVPAATDTSRASAPQRRRALRALIPARPCGRRPPAARSAAEGRRRPGTARLRRHTPGESRIQPLVAGEHPLRAVLERRSPRGAPEARSQHRISCQLRQPVGDRARLAIDQEAVAAVVDQLADAVDGRRQDRQATGRRLEGDQRERLIARWQHERVGQPVDEPAPRV